MRKNWARSDWKKNGDENKKSGWRNPVSGNLSSKLETVHEDDDTISETRSEGIIIPTILDFGILGYVSKTSNGTVSDPGDSYGGREYRRSDERFIS